VETGPEQIGMLAWFVLGATIAFVAAVVALIRSGRSVPLAWFRRRRTR